MDASTQPELLPLLQTLLASPSPLTLGATLTAFSEICPDRLDLLHPYYRHICRLLGDADEWGQVVALEVLTRYARAMLEKPEVAARTNGKGSDDEFEGLDIDLAMLLDLSKPLLRSRNGAVVVAAAKMYYNLAPAGHPSVGQEVIVAPLLRLAGTSGADASSGSEISAVTWDVISSMAEERPWLFAGRFAHFFLHTADPAPVMTAKLRAMVAMVGEENAPAAIREFKQYTALPADGVAEEAVRAIGHCVRSQPAVAETGLRSLMRLLKSTRSESAGLSAS
jgi:AP-3 complex subunit beta